jgi:hypothetical protein
VPECLSDAACTDQNVCTIDLCIDGACSHEPVPPGGTEAVCNDMADDDCDGVVDCDDPDCVGIDTCPPIKRDPSRIVFGPPGGLDLFTSHGRVEPTEPIDPGTVEVGWMVSNGRGPVYRGALIPGDLTANRKRNRFVFKDSGARSGQAKRFGIYRAKIRITRRGTSYGYKIKAYGDLSAATDPDMVVQFYIGDQVWVHDEPWIPRGNGWRSTAFD